MGTRQPGAARVDGVTLAMIERQGVATFRRELYKPRLRAGNYSVRGTIGRSRFGVDTFPIQTGCSRPLAIPVM
jgi:hypothetical protein